MSVFWGAQQLPNGSYTKVPEQVPVPTPGRTWYRRGTPLTTPEIAQDQLEAYLSHPVLLGANAGRTNVSNLPRFATKWLSDTSTTLAELCSYVRPPKTNPIDMAE